MTQSIDELVKRLYAAYQTHNNELFREAAVVIKNMGDTCVATAKQLEEADTAYVCLALQNKADFDLLNSLEISYRLCDMQAFDVTMAEVKKNIEGRVNVKDKSTPRG